MSEAKTIINNFQSKIKTQIEEKQNQNKLRIEKILKRFNENKNIPFDYDKKLQELKLKTNHTKNNNILERLQLLKTDIINNDEIINKDKIIDDEIINKDKIIDDEIINKDKIIDDKIINKDKIIDDSIMVKTNNIRSGREIRGVNNIKNRRIKYINKKFGNKKHILLIVNIYDWAFHNIAKKIKENDTKNNYIILNNKECLQKLKKQSSIFDNFHIVLSFWYGDLADKILNTISNRKTKKILCIYDSSIWVNNNKTHELEYYQKVINKITDETQYVMGASPKIIEHLHNEKTNNIINLAKNKISPCFDGVDINMFYYTDYHHTIYDKKKLTIGWIGNSNPNSQGINKGFAKINEVLENMTDKFIFKPQDAFHKKISHNKIPIYLENIDIIICFSQNEGTPNQILEASSMGKCWISTDVGIVSELNNPACGLIIKRNKKQLRAALEQLYDNRKLIVEMGRVGRKNIETSWSWNQKVNQFYDVFQKL
jgi:glycosyltransferase involved in cell wall biosynthesis